MAAPGGGYQNQGGMPQQGHQMMYGSQNQGQPMQGQAQIRGNYPPQSMMMPHMGMQPSFGAPGMQQQMMHQSSHQQQYGMMGGTHNQMMGGQMIMHQQQMQNMGGSMPAGMPMNQDYQMSQPGPHQSSTMSGGMGSQGPHGMGASGYAMSGNNYSNMNQGMPGMGQPMPMSQSMQQQPMQQQPMQQQPMQQQPMQQPQMQQPQMQQPQMQTMHQMHQTQSQQQLQQPGSQQMSHLQQPLSNQGILQPMSNQNIQQPLSQQAQHSQSKSPMVSVMTQQHTPQSIQQMTPQMVQPQSTPGASCGPLSVGPSTQAPMSQGPPLSVNPATPGPQSHEPPKTLTSVPGVQTQKQNYIHSKALDENSKNQPIVQDCVLAAKRLIQYDLRATYFEWSRKIGDSIRSGNENFREVRRARDDVLAVCDLIESNMTTFIEAHKQMTKVDKVFEKEKVVSSGSGEILTQFSVISNYNSSTQQSMDNFHRTVNNVSSLLKQMRKRQQKDPSVISSKRKRGEIIDRE